MRDQIKNLLLSENFDEVQEKIVQLYGTLTSERTSFHWFYLASPRYNWEDNILDSITALKVRKFLDKINQEEDE